MTLSERELAVRQKMRLWVEQGPLAVPKDSAAGIIREALTVLESAEKRIKELERKFMQAVHEKTAYIDEVHRLRARVAALEEAARRAKELLGDYTQPAHPRLANVYMILSRVLDQALAEEVARRRPRIVCLCGSTRFKSAFDEANYQRTMAGQIVLSIGFYMHATGNRHGEDVGATPEQKIALDELHLRKIDLADEVFVLNVGGYIGDSTRREIEYAKTLGKPVSFLEADPNEALAGGGSPK